MHVSLHVCVCKVCCPTNDAFVVVVVFACTNYFILQMYHKHSYVCVCIWSHCDCDGHLKTYEIYVLCVLGLPEHTATHLEIGEQSINQSINLAILQSISIETYHRQGTVHKDICPIAFAIVYIHYAIVITIARIGSYGCFGLNKTEYPTHLVL